MNPQHTWTFKALDEDIDLPRILRETRQAGCTVARITVGDSFDALYILVGSFADKAAPPSLCGAPPYENDRFWAKRRAQPPSPHQWRAFYEGANEVLQQIADARANRKRVNVEAF